MINKDGTKKCKKCGIEKPLNEFNKHKEMKDGHRNECKECLKEYRKQWREQNKEAKKEYDKQYYEQNKEYMKEYAKEYKKQYYEQNKDKYYIRNHNRKAMKNALPNTLTDDEWHDITNELGNKCILTNKSDDVSIEHFIPLSIGHGGTYKGNVYPMDNSLNIGKSNKNPFKWIKSQDGKAQHIFHNVLVPYLAKQNNMDTKTFKRYVNWCFENKRTLEQVEEDNAKGLTSIDIFYMSEQTN